MKKKKLYLMVTQDKYALPMAVADSISQLAKMQGIKARTISSYICKQTKKGFKYPKYIVIEVDEEEFE